MFLASGRFFYTMLRSHTVETDVRILDAPNAALDIINGSVDGSASDAIRRRCSLTVVDSTGFLTPKDANDIMQPFSTEFQVWRGVKYYEGFSETISQGVFRLTSTKITSNKGLTQIEMDGFDRAHRIQRPFPSTYSMAAGIPFADAIRDMTRVNYPGIDFHAPFVSYLTPLGLFTTSQNPWDEARKLSDNIGAELFMDRVGVETLRPVPTTANGEAWHFIDGENSTVTNIERSVSSDEVPNGVIVVGQNSGSQPIQAEAWDMDPASPTYRYGRYGQNAIIVRSSLVRSYQQAYDAAVGVLAKRLGRAEQITITAIPNPALDYGDAVRVTCEREGIDDVYIIDQMTMPFRAADSMTLTVRKTLYRLDREPVQVFDIGPVAGTGHTWDELPGTWDTLTGTWDDQ